MYNQFKKIIINTVLIKKLLCKIVSLVKVTIYEELYRVSALESFETF